MFPLLLQFQSNSVLLSFDRISSFRLLGEALRQLDLVQLVEILGPRVVFFLVHLSEEENLLFAVGMLFGFVGDFLLDVIGSLLSFFDLLDVVRVHSTLLVEFVFLLLFSLFFLLARIFYVLLETFTNFLLSIYDLLIDRNHFV